MSTISNRFFVTAVDDGTTLHGELRATQSMSQAWNGTAAIPSWSEVSGGVYVNSPIVYLTLLSGSTAVEPNAGYVWDYNGSVISTEGSSSESKTFRIGNTNTSYTGKMSTDGRFFVINNFIVDGKTMPAIAIVGNLASTTNPDTDTLTLTGTYTIGTANIDFSNTATIRITRITSNGYFGQVNFVGGISDITEKNQIITAYAVLYDQSGNSVNGFTTKWYLNDASTGTAGAAKTVDGHTYQQAYQVSESQVVDYATLKCEFYYAADGVNSAIVFTAIEGIDDRQDDEYLYIQRSGVNGNNASLHKDDSAVQFQFFVGTTSDPTPQGNWGMKVKLFEADGTEITSDLTSYNAGVTTQTDGYYVLTVTQNKGTISVSYALATEKGKGYLSGIVYAYQTS